VETTNPAGRLFEILSRARAIAAPVTNIGANKLWADVFSIKPEADYEIEVILRLLQFKKLIEETEESFEKDRRDN
jgi:hypothetical protein